MVKSNLINLKKIKIGQTVTAVCKSEGWVWPADVREISFEPRIIKCLIRVEKQINQVFDFDPMTGMCVDGSIDLLLVNLEFPKEEMGGEEKNFFIETLMSKISWLKNGNTESSFLTFGIKKKPTCQIKNNLGLRNILNLL